MTTKTFASPLQFAASITADFVLDETRKMGAGATLLDIGCGNGIVAVHLIQGGCHVTGVDANEESVTKAQSSGVNAIHSQILEFEHEPVDLILLSRSFHHMPPLAETTEKLRSLLKPHGLIALEDFGFELIDEASAAWLLDKTKLIKKDPDAAAPYHKWLWESENLTPAEACKLWTEQHFVKHQILTSSEMKEALAKRFTTMSMTTPAFLFRYLCDFLPATTDGAAWAAGLWQEETSLIESGKLNPVGLRMLLRRN